MSHLETSSTVAEKRVSFGASWETYQAIAAALGDRSSPCFAYYHAKVEGGQSDRSALGFGIRDSELVEFG